MINMKHSQQRGLTLIELMVALIISLLILAGLFTVYQSNQRGNRLNDGLMRTQENGRFAIDFLIRDIRQAAFPANDVGVKSFLFQGSANNAAVAGSPNTSDVLVLRHGTIGSETQDCSGQTPTNGGNADGANGLNNTTMNQYDIRATRRTNNRGLAIFALFCNNTELVEGIENMQVLYGVDTDVPFNSRDFVANQYFTFNTVPDLDGDGITDWSRVVSLRIALLANSVDARTTLTSTRTFNLLDTTIPAFNDQMIRRVYTTTVLIRNNATL